MSDDLVARAATTIDAPVARVWDTFTSGKTLSELFFGAEVSTDWAVGSPITWKGEWNGQAYEDHGTVLEFNPAEALSFSHFSPLTGEPDIPENYHVITVTFTGMDGSTNVELTQTRNKTPDDVAHSEANWQMMLEKLSALCTKD